MMNLPALVEAIKLRAKGRYDVSSADEMELPEVGHESLILRLKRAAIDKAGWRTILLIELPFVSAQDAHQWAASVRDVLPEPETSDLFMFMMLDGVSLDEAARIETDERFCRKIVARQLETPMDFLDRTFLAALDPPEVADTLSDPLVAALQSLSLAQPWTKDCVDLWKKNFLSATSGVDIVRSLRMSMVRSEDQQ